MKRVSNRKLRRAQSTKALIRSRRPRPLGVSLARFSSVVAVCGALFAGLGSAEAATLSWDASGVLLTHDGGGIWTNLGGFWDTGTSPTPGTSTTWNNATPDNAV